MLIGGIGSSTVMPRATRQGDAAPRDAGPAECRALIPVAAPAPSEHGATLTRRPLVAFLAHLIATETRAPQTRPRRRAEPEEATEIYARPVSSRGRGSLDVRA